MGVMSCSRKDCENIMCRTHVDGVGYICDECESEFKEYIEKRVYTQIQKDKLKENQINL